MPELRLPTARTQATQFAPPSVQQASTAVQLSKAAMQAPGRGLASAGQDIQQVGQQMGTFFAELNKKKQGAKDKSAEWKYRLRHQEVLNNLKIDAQQRVTAGKLDSDAQYEYINNGISEWEKNDGANIISSASPEAQEGIYASNRLKTENDLIAYRVQVAKNEIAQMKADYDLNKESLISDGTEESLDRLLNEDLPDAVSTGIIGKEKQGEEAIAIQRAWARRRQGMESANAPKSTLEIIKQAKKGKKSGENKGGLTKEEWDNLPRWAKLLDDELLDEAERETKIEMSSMAAEGNRSLTLGISKLHNSDKYPDVPGRTADELWKEANTLFQQELINADQLENYRKDIYFKPDVHNHLASHVSKFKGLVTNAKKLAPEQQQVAIHEYIEMISRKDVKILAETRNELIDDFTQKVTGTKEYSSDDYSHAKSQAFRLVDIEVDRAIGTGDVQTPNPNSALARFAGFTKRDDEDGDYYQINEKGEKVAFDPNDEDHREMIHRAAEQVQDAVREKLKNGVEYNKAVNEVLYPEASLSRVDLSKTLLGVGNRATPAGIESARNTYMMFAK